jgi:predicted thioredoxin/glutaredoxin
MNLDIYIDDACNGCQEARKIAEHVSEQLPHVAVNLVDLTQPSAVKPNGVFAVPTYVLDGETLYLGNPAEADLLRQLEEKRT